MDLNLLPIDRLDALDDFTPRDLTSRRREVADLIGVRNAEVAR